MNPFHGSLRRSFPALHHVAVAPLVALLALGAPTVSAAGSADGVELRPKYAAGQEVLSRITMQQTQDITGAGMPAPMKQSTEQLQDITLKVVEERPEGGHELEVGFTQMRLETRMGDMVVLKFDSAADAASDASNPAGPLLRALVGSKFHLLTDAKGEVTQVTGLKELMATISANAPPMMNGMLEGLISEENLKQMAGSAQGLPGGAVKEGDTWPVKQDMALGPLGRLLIDMTMTFKGWETFEGRRCARIDHTGTLKSSPTQGTNAVSLVSLTGDTTGRMYFDAEAGVARETTAVQKMEMKLQAMGQDITSQMTQHVTNRLVEIRKTR